MAFPICEACADSGLLCDKCQKKVRTGQVSELDVLLSSILAQHKATGYGNIVDLETKLVILASEKDAKDLIGPGGSTAEDVSKKLGRRVIILVRDWDKQRIAESLARPARLVNKNTIFRPGGQEVLKLIFDKQIDEGSLKLIKELAGGIEIGYQETGFVKIKNRQ